MTRAVWGAFFALGLAAGPASADGGLAASTMAVALHATPIFGADASSGYGWTEIVARVDNGGSAPLKGNLELTSTVAYGREQEFVTRAPFGVPGGRTVVIHIPTHGYAFQPATMTLNAMGENGAKLASTSISVNASVAPLLVDVDEPSRLSVVLRSAPVATAWSSGASGGASAMTPLTVGAAAFDGRAGDPILPAQAAGYAAATVVLIHSDALARLEAAPLDALVDWVLSGGTVAVVPTRPEDLRGPTLTSLAGGVVRATDPPSALSSLPSLPPASPSALFGIPPASAEDDPGGKGGGAGGGVTGGSAPALIRSGPSSAVRPRLAGYAGGNLQPSHYGATAPYGLGEVHLLAFDPTVSPGIDDPWVQARVIELVGHAWDRRAVNAFRQGSLPQSPYQLNDVRRSLDPNENFRPALGVAAILLVLYSIVAGPVTFLRASKSNNPLSPLRWAPVWSALTFAAVVLVGLAGKGWRGRARHLSFIEAGAGASRGAIHRFRGFFTSEARAMSIATTDRTCVLDVIGEEAAKEHRVFRIDRNGGALENLTSLPWQTVVVAEDGFTELGAGVALLAGADGSIDVVNGSGRDLSDVIVYVPGQDLTYFAELKNGARTRSSAGKTMSTARRHATTAGTRRIHPLETSDMGNLLDVATSERMREAWRPVESAAGGEVDWLPDDAPVLLAEIVGGEGTTRDSALSVERDRTLLRVVGAGGGP